MAERDLFPATPHPELPALILLGAVAALVAATISRHRGLASFRRVWAVGLAVAAAIYVAFAALAGGAAALAIEAVGLLVFGAIAWLGARRWPSLVALGWMAHAGWDLALHPPVSGSWAPEWYPPLCVGFDLVVAGYLAGASAAEAPSGGTVPDGTRLGFQQNQEASDLDQPTREAPQP